MKRPSLLVSVLALLFPLVDGCADLPAITHGTCGNAVLDPGEDCDSFASNGQFCRPAGVV